MMPRLTWGSLNHRPIFKGLWYTDPVYLALSPLSRTFTQAITCPAVGPNRVMYVWCWTTRSSAASSYTAPTFNGRTMTAEMDLNSLGTFTKPVQWWSIKLLDSETTGNFVWTENLNAGSIFSYYLRAYFTRGMQLYNKANGNQNVAYYSTGTTQTNTMTLSRPPGRSYALVGAIKPFLDTGDTSSFNSCTGIAAIASNYALAQNNSVINFQGHSQYNNITGSSVNETFTVVWNSTSVPGSYLSGIVVY